MRAQKNRIINDTVKIMVAGAVRLELTTYGFGDRCSTSWAIPLWGDLWGSNPCMLEPQSSVLTASPKPPYKFYKETREPRDSRVPLRQLPTLPRRLQRSTLGLWTLNYCVRNGNRWNRSGIITAYLNESCSLKTSQKKLPCKCIG